MTERVVHRDEYRGEQVLIDDLPPHGLLDLIVDQDGISASARLDAAAVTDLRDALDVWLGARS